MKPNRRYTVKKDREDSRDLIFSPNPSNSTNYNTLKDIAASIQVLDQGNLGSCTANSAIFILNILRQLAFSQFKEGALPKDTVMSRLFQYYAERRIEGSVDEDSGAQSRTIARAMSQYGWLPESSYPYDVDRFTNSPTESQYAEAKEHAGQVSYHRILSVDDAKSCLSSGYPFTIGLDLYESFESEDLEKTGLLSMPKPGEGYIGGHEIGIYAFEDEKECPGAKGAFLARNSYGKDWGINGDFYIPYDYVKKYGMDMWLIHLGKPWKAS